MLLTIILLFLVSLIIYLLFMPITMVIDTRRGQYYIQLKGLVKACIVPDKEEILRIKLNVVFLSFNLYPLRAKLSSKQNKKPKKAHKKKSKNSLNFKTGLRILKSFKIEQFYLNLDTGSCITNAKLYPLFAFLSYYKGSCNINFTGQNTLLLTIKNRPIRIIKSFINL